MPGGSVSATTFKIMGPKKEAKRRAPPSNRLHLRRMFDRAMGGKKWHGPPPTEEEENAARVVQVNLTSLATSQHHFRSNEQ
jgi:hypothetical protein